MSFYTVIIMRKGEHVSSFIIEAVNLRLAELAAANHKRLEGIKGKAYVKYIKP